MAVLTGEIGVIGVTELTVLTVLTVLTGVLSYILLSHNNYQKGTYMLNVLLLDTLVQNNKNVSDMLKTAYNQRELPISRLALFNEVSALSRYSFENKKQFNVFIATFSKPEEEFIELARMFRMINENIFIVFVVDRIVDVTSCVRPSVRPSGVLFVPLDKQCIYQTVREIYAEFIRVSERETQPVFTVRSEGEYYTVNTGDIMFFEAQGKKIAIKTRGQEILFYSNFESVLEKLPDWFVRCHKGYIVNTNEIVQTSFTKMTLSLRDQSCIPMSRTYRDEIRLLVEAKGA